MKLLNHLYRYIELRTGHQRMIERNSDRDTWKLANWDEYISGCNFEKPEGIPELWVFKNSSMEEFNESMAELVKHFKN